MLRLVQGIHPRAVALPDGLGHAGAPGNDRGPATSLRALFPFRIGPEGLQDWGPLGTEIGKG
ncbi:MAG: hypothetical protein HY900_22755 [Deltaproteobacteria bacterium]|nr:hypothetical protein [Deltaproteobacteria bacterium]